MSRLEVHSSLGTMGDLVLEMTWVMGVMVVMVGIRGCHQRLSNIFPRLLLDYKWAQPRYRNAIINWVMLSVHVIRHASKQLLMAKRDCTAGAVTMLWIKLSVSLGFFFTAVK